eukprot:TRINITY_DN106_c0_g1_i1.p1 TRINITY_DN106_c0_g1~~TRINITY_DN106_c0_g1_i1.p1  ORF type:complete len:553 (+),score=137.57 TRINITY_DN106_c0_g1_i1:146-1804(+)
MRSFVLLAGLSLALAAVHPRGALPSGWTQSEVLELSNTPITVSLALHENYAALAELKAYALEISNPQSPKYGEYLSKTEIAQLVGPSADCVSTVSQWLTEADVKFAHRGSNMVITCSHAQAEQLFSTKFSMVYNNQTNQAVVRAADFSLPDHIEQHTAAVFGLHGLPLPPRVRSTDPSTPAIVTPDVLTKTYGITGVTPKSTSKNSQAVAEFQGQYMDPKDLTDFFKKFVSNYQAGTDDVVSKFVGDKNLPEGQTEASLDIQYMMGVSVGIKSEFWLYNSNDFCGDLANWTNTILSTEGAPTVHSVSYGWQGDLAQLQCTDDKVKVVDDNLAKLAANGVSIIIASGDSGSGYANSEPPKLWPSWPASSGWVTSVGATRFVDQKVGNSEMATDQFGSGGGFSTMFTIATDAPYQADDVKNFLKIAPQLPPSGSFPKTGRATPDVSALGEGYQVVQNGGTMSVGGTSASTPLFAGIVGMLNEARIQAGKPALGFLNPFIYQNADAFTDCVLGDNAYGRGAFRTKYGFNTTKGWDPVTGVGSPIFSKLLAAALKK